jgi:hypothetical protein
MCVTADIFALDDKVRKLWALPEDFHVPVGKVHGLCVTDIRSLNGNGWLTDNVRYITCMFVYLDFKSLF